MMKSIVSGVAVALVVFGPAAVFAAGSALAQPAAELAAYAEPGDGDHGHNGADPSDDSDLEDPVQEENRGQVGSLLDDLQAAAGSHKPTVDN